MPGHDPDPWVPVGRSEPVPSPGILPDLPLLSSPPPPQTEFHPFLWSPSLCLSSTTWQHRFPLAREAAPFLSAWKIPVRNSFRDSGGWDNTSSGKPPGSPRLNHVSPSGLTAPSLPAAWSRTAFGSGAPFACLSPARTARLPRAGAIAVSSAGCWGLPRAGVSKSTPVE